jgi:hypothetical protein
MAGVIPRTVLIVAEPLAGLSAQRVASALAKGLEAPPRELRPDALCVQDPPSEARQWWGAAQHGERLRAARAVVIAVPRLDERTLAGSLAFEVATSARQAGVPAYAVSEESELDPFDARMLDLQAILQARTQRALTAAGRRLAEIS